MPQFFFILFFCQKWSVLQYKGVILFYFYFCRTHFWAKMTYFTKVMFSNIVFKSTHMFYLFPLQEYIKYILFNKLDLEAFNFTCIDWEKKVWLLFPFIHNSFCFFIQKWSFFHITLYCCHYCPLTAIVIESHLTEFCFVQLWKVQIPSIFCFTDISKTNISCVHSSFYTNNVSVIRFFHCSSVIRQDKDSMFNCFNTCGPF